MLKVRVWTARAGHITLYLLDTNIPDNSDADRAITHQLYGGDREMRLQQELVLGVGGSWLFSLLIPALPAHTSWSYAAAAELLAVVVGLIAGVLPARRAAGLHPVEALRAE